MRPKIASAMKFRATVMTHMRTSSRVDARLANTVPTGIRKFSVNSSARPIVMNTNPRPNSSEPST